jgi:predicted enzyme related to lactoylglutathione lyase
MRTRLLEPLGQRPPRRGRRARAALAPPMARDCDPAVERVREAGGPVDRAIYSCQCGCLFRAAVSTTVPCPHCGTDQAW